MKNTGKHIIVKEKLSWNMKMESLQQDANYQLYSQRGRFDWKTSKRPRRVLYQNAEEKKNTEKEDLMIQSILYYLQTFWR